MSISRALSALPTPDARRGSGPQARRIEGSAARPAPTCSPSWGGPRAPRPAGVGTSRDVCGGWRGCGRSRAALTLWGEPSLDLAVACARVRTAGRPATAGGHDGHAAVGAGLWPTRLGVVAHERAGLGARGAVPVLAHRRLLSGGGHLMPSPVLRVRCGVVLGGAPAGASSPPRPFPATRARCLMDAACDLLDADPASGFGCGDSSGHRRLLSGGRRPYRPPDTHSISTRLTKRKGYVADTGGGR